MKKRILPVWYRFCFIFSTHHCASFFLSRQRCKNDSEKEWNESADLHWFLGIELREESSAPKNQIANHSLLGFFLCACVCVRNSKDFAERLNFCRLCTPLHVFYQGCRKIFDRTKRLLWNFQVTKSQIGRLKKKCANFA